MLCFVLERVGLNPIELFNRAEENAGDGAFTPAPGGLYTNPVDTLSLGLALVLGTAGVPHVLMRFFTVPDAKAARGSVVWAIFLIGSLYLLTMFIGFGARARRPARAATSRRRRSRLSSAAARAPSGAACSSLPIARFNTTGAVTGVLFGVINATALVIVSPGVWPGPDSEGSPLGWGLANPGIVSIPLGCWLGTVLSSERSAERSFHELYVRSETGLGAEKASIHP